MDQELQWLLNWWDSQNHSSIKTQQQFSIGTLDNPGWFLCIPLDGTKFRDVMFPKVLNRYSEHNWFDAFVQDGCFQGAGGPFNLPEIIQVFRNWVELSDQFTRAMAGSKPTNYLASDDFLWLTKWFYFQCDGDWEHTYYINIDNHSETEWSVEICIAWTELQSAEFTTLEIRRSAEDWLRCSIEDVPIYKKIFRGKGSSSNLLEIIKIFREWVERVTT